MSGVVENNIHFFWNVIHHSKKKLFPILSSYSGETNWEKFYETYFVERQRHQGRP